MAGVDRADIGVGFLGPRIGVVRAEAPDLVLAAIGAADLQSLTVVDLPRQLAEQQILLER